MCMGPHAEIISTFFQHMKCLVVAGFAVGDLVSGNLSSVTAKNLYQGFTSSFPNPKAISKFQVDWNQVWQRLQSPLLSSLGREVLFLVIHNIVANKERMFKFHMSQSPNCPTCGVVQDNSHLFCECLCVREAWFWIRQRLISMLPGDGGKTSNFEFINLMFDSGTLDNEIVWLLGVYVTQVWKQVICKKRTLKLLSIMTEVSQEYKAHYLSHKQPLAHITGLLQ